MGVAVVTMLLLLASSAVGQCTVAEMQASGCREAKEKLLERIFEGTGSQWTVERWEEEADVQMRDVLPVDGEEQFRERVR